MTFITPVDGQDAVAEHVAQLTEALTGVRAEEVTLTGALRLQGATAGTNVLQTRVAGDATQRFRVDAEGRLEWTTPSTGAVTVSLVKSGTTLLLTGDLTPATTLANSLGSPTLLYQQVYARELIAHNDSTGYLRVGATGAAAAGAIRLRNAANVSWRNAGNTADLALTANASNQLTWGGLVVVTQTALDALTTRVATLESQVAALTSDLEAHTHQAGTWDNLGGTANVP
jgi:outer membrane murein-binding lipoprotein Lpp